MRKFNTTGPCDPEKHYTVMREALVVEGTEMIEEGHYFTIFAPRQTGKTTYFQLLFRALREEGYTPVWVSFESLGNVSQADFYRTFGRELKRKLALLGIELDAPIASHIDLQEFLEDIRVQTDKLVLVIDEFEDIPDVVLSDVLHTFRKIYHQKEFYALHAIILVGVSTMAELVVSSASPFNIANELQISYFTLDETEELIDQYTTESGQLFEPTVVKAIYDNTRGQPGLVCTLCNHLTQQKTDRSQTITIDDFYTTFKHFLAERFDRNILNIVQKATEKQSFMLSLLFKETPVAFSIHVPDIAYLYAHGVIHNVKGYVEIAVPLYSKCLITAFRPHINGETDYYLNTQEHLSEYTSQDGLNVDAILHKYRDYVRRRGFRAFDTKQLKEGAWHYSLDGFINFVIELLEGDTLVEAPSGRGRTDILIFHKNKKYIVETKIFTANYRFENGKYQLADYLEAEKLDEGYYVVFSKSHKPDEQLDFDERINGKRIRTYIICLEFHGFGKKAIYNQPKLFSRNR